MSTPRAPSPLSRVTSRMGHHRDSGDGRSRDSGDGRGRDSGDGQSRDAGAVEHDRADPEPDAEQAVEGLRVEVYADGHSVAWRDTGATSASIADLQHARRVALERGGFVWVSLHDPDPSTVAAIGRAYDLSPRTVSMCSTPETGDPDAARAGRPQLHVLGQHLVLVVKSCLYVDHPEETAISDIQETGEAVVLLTPDWVLSVRHGPTPELDGLHSGLTDRPKLLAHGPAVVLHEVVERVIAAYGDVADEVQVDIDELDTAVFAGGRQPPVEKAYRMRRELIRLRAAVNPLISPLSRLAEQPAETVHEGAVPLIRDLNDHLDRVRYQVASLDGLLDSITDACLAQVTMGQNDDMRRISAWVAIAAVPTAIAGVYGMNFEHMPELTWTFGYPLVLAVMLVICTALYVAFRRRHWL